MKVRVEAGCGQPAIPDVAVEIVGEVRQGGEEGQPEEDGPPEQDPWVIQEVGVPPQEDEEGEKRRGPWDQGGSEEVP